MAEITRTVKDKKEFESIFNNFYVRSTVFLKTKTENIQVIFQSYFNDIITLKTSNPLGACQQCILYIRKDDQLVSTHLVLKAKEGETTYQFEPHTIQFIQIPRKDERRNVDKNRTKKKEEVFITDIITDFQIKESLGFEKRLTENIRDQLQNNLLENFNKVRVFFANDGSDDMRHQLFTKDMKPLFIPNIGNPEEYEKRKELYDYYNKEIYGAGVDSLQADGMISEISVPFLIKTMIPFGYVQVNSRDSLTSEQLQMLKKTGISISDLFAKNNVFKISSDKIVINDVSANGLSLSFKEKRFIQHFKEKAVLTCNIVFPGNKKATMLLEVRNINLFGDGSLVVGCLIMNIDALGEVYYEELVESMSEDN